MIRQALGGTPLGFQPISGTPYGWLIRPKAATTLALPKANVVIISTTPLDELPMDISVFSVAQVIQLVYPVKGLNVNVYSVPQLVQVAYPVKGLNVNVYSVAQLVQVVYPVKGMNVNVYSVSQLAQAVYPVKGLNLNVYSVPQLVNIVINDG